MPNFSSGHDLTVCGSGPASGSVLTAQSLEPAYDSVSPSLSAPPLLVLCLSLKNKQTFEKKLRGAWVAQLVKCLTLAQVMILQFVSLSPMSGSVLTPHSLEPASDPVSPSLSAPPLLTLCPSLKNK